MRIMFRKILLAVSLIISCTAVLKSQTTGNCVIDVIMSGYSPRMFTADPVSDQHLDLILKCGIKAPSASNRQPWKFTVVKDTTLMGEAIKGTVPGNILIFVSRPEENQRADIDCALTTQSMFVAAQGLGLGARIYTGPVSNVNTNLKEKLGIPEGYQVATILRIGHMDKSVDAISAATPRKPIEEVVNYK